jgi:hypothetical protein
MRTIILSALFALFLTAADAPKPAAAKPLPSFPEVEALQLEKIQLSRENLQLQIRLMQQAQQILERGYARAGVDLQAYDVNLAQRTFVKRAPAVQP